MQGESTSVPLLEVSAIHVGEMIEDECISEFQFKKEDLP